jgi:hypothetical protein
VQGAGLVGVVVRCWWWVWGCLGGGFNQVSSQGAGMLMG